jgi:hypothetical protein
MNPSFEQLKGCPNTYEQADSVTYWNWINNFCDTVTHSECKGNIFTMCCTNSACSQPYNWEGYQKPKTGDSYIGLLSIFSVPPFSNNRSYLKGQLNSTLQAGKSYCLTFFYNASNTIEYASNRFGAYVDNNMVANYNCCKDMPVIPQAQNNPSVFMTDTLNWVKIQNSFTAIGNENTITLGNFVDSATIQYQLFNSNGTHGFYYNIDDVSLIQMDLPAYAGRDTSITHGDSTYIGRTNEVGLNDDCFWHILGNATPIDTVAGMWVKPSTTTSYVLEQNICGTVTYDTVTVSVVPTGIKQFASNTMQLKIYPNPSTGDVYISSNDLSDKDWKLIVTDVTGRTVIENNYAVNNSLVKLNTQLTNGVYFIKVIMPDGTTKQQKVIITK